MNPRHTEARRSSEYSSQSSESTPKVIPLRNQLSKEKKNAAKFRIYKMLYSDWRAWVGTLTSLLLGMFPVLIFLFFGDLINSFSKPTHEIMDNVNSCVIKIVSVTVVTAVLRYIDALVWIRLGSSLSIKIRKDLFRAMMKADVIFFDKTPIGAILTMLSEDSQLVQTVFGTNKGMQTQNISQMLLSIALSFAKKWQLGLILLAVIPLSLLVSFPWFPGIISDTAQRFHYTAESMTIAEEVLSSIRTVRGFNKEKDEAERFIKETKRSAKYESHVSMRLSGMMACLMLVIWSAVILALYVGGILVDKGMKKNDTSFGVGHLFSVFGYMMFGSFGLMNVTNTSQGEQKASAAGARIFEMSEYEPIIPYEGGRIIENFKGHIKFVNVTFQYPTRPVNVLRNVSFEVKPGQVAALVGHSGSGKSTCVQLLERYYDVQEGIILLDDIDIKEVDPRWLHKQLSIVAQEPLLFHTTIRNNITYGLDEVSDEDVRNAASASNALKFIEKLPKKFDEEVGERGSTLSGGQRQRIAIARAIVRKPVVLITDEATSALDAGSEKKVQQALDNILQNMTGIVVAHRLSTIKNADIIYVFETGVIVEQGKHDELVAKGGAYYNLVKRQISIEAQKQEKEAEAARAAMENKEPKVEEVDNNNNKEEESSSSLSVSKSNGENDSSSLSSISSTSSSSSKKSSSDEKSDSKKE